MTRFSLAFGFALCALLLPAAQAQPGTLDPSFSDDGVFTLQIDPNVVERGEAVLPLPDGGLLVGGVSGDDPLLLRLTPDGELDASFGDAGVLLLPTPAFAGEVTVGRIVSDGGDGAYLTVNRRSTDDDQASVSLLLHVLPSGAFDEAFGDGGIAQLPGERPFVFLGLARQPNGGLVVCGTSLAPNESEIPFVVRFDAGGELDESYGPEDANPFPANESGSPFFPYALTAYADGRIGVIGSWTESLEDGGVFAARLTSDGTLDASFGDGGVTVLPASAQEFSLLTAAAVDGAGRLVATGFTTNFVTANALLVRFDTDGGLDASFGDGGIVRESFAEITSGYALALQPDDTPVLIGSTGEAQYTQPFVAQYTASGELDTTFGEDGVVRLDIGQSAAAIAGALRPTGEVVVAGHLSDEDGAEFGFLVAQVRGDALPEAAEPGAGPEAAFALGTPYPNPTQAEAWVPLGGTAAHVRVELFDALGRQVALVHDGPVREDALRLDLGKLPAGLYIVRATDGRHLDTQRIVKR